MLAAVEPVEERIAIRVERSTADRIYRAVAFAGGMSTLVLMVAIGGFLFVKAWPALREARLSFLTEQQWSPAGLKYGIGSLLPLTVEIAVVALVIAVPVSIGAALFLTEYAPGWMRRPLTTLVDVLAAIPSLIYGLWGAFFLMPRLIDVSRWLTDHMSFVPFFKTTQSSYGNSTFIAGCVVALMVLPICTAVTREVFSQAPPGEKEGALALGATKWGMIRTVVIPFGRGGIIGGAILGLGRALGETIAVAIIIAPTFERQWHILDGKGNSIAALIANQTGESSPFAISALLAAGLALFALTLVVNFFASIVVNRSRSGAATEI